VKILSCGTHRKAAPRGRGQARTVPRSLLMGALEARRGHWCECVSGHVVLWLDELGRVVGQARGRGPLQLLVSGRAAHATCASVSESRPYMREECSACQTRLAWVQSSISIGSNGAFARLSSVNIGICTEVVLLGTNRFAQMAKQRASANHLLSL
jgi:hypothetical protein